MSVCPEFFIESFLFPGSLVPNVSGLTLGKKPSGAGHILASILRAWPCELPCWTCITNNWTRGTL